MQAGFQHPRIVDIFGADLRSLALLRILLAVIVLMDLAGRSPYLVAHYSDQGVLPRRDLLLTLNQWRWSLNLINGTTVFQQLLLGATIVGAIAMLLGYRTRLASILVWVLITSLQVRNPALLSGADTLLRLLLFWCMFLPLGARWSLDRAIADANVRQEEPSRATHTLSFATVGIFLQIAFMYWFTALLKESPQWRSEGTALYYALGARDITTPLGNYLHQFPDLLRVLTFGSLGLEIIAPILLFFPFRTGPIRTIAVFSLVGFHAGIWLTMNVGIFPWTSAVCMACFLPTWFWDTALPRLRAWLPAPQRLKATWSSAIDLRLKPAVARVSQSLNVLHGIPAELSTPASMTTSSLEQSALGAQPSMAGGARTQAPSLSTTRKLLHGNPLLNLACCFLIVFVFFWNVSSVSDFQMPAASKPIAYSLAIYQNWSMFAPRPQQATIWYVVEGTLANGDEIDLLTPIIENDMSIVQSPVWDQSRNIQHDDKYWRKYLAAIKGNDTEQVRFAAYACRQWNAAHVGDESLTGVQLFTISARTLPDDFQAEPVRTRMGSYRCL